MAKQPVPRYYLGCDLGQAMDYTAIVGIEALDISAMLDKRNREKEQAAKDADVRVVFLERAQAPYNRVAERLKQLVEGPHFQTVWPRSILIDRAEYDDTVTVPPRMAIDATGVGRGVVDFLRAEGLKFDPVQLTSGMQQTRDGIFFNVPKKDIVSNPIIAFQNGWIKIAEGLDHREQLEHELLNYRVKVNLRTGRETSEAWRENDHDDIVLALSLALWSAIRARSDWRRRALSGGFARMPMFG